MMANLSDRAISLFSGAGGCSLGFRDAGLPPSLAVDNDPDAAASYSQNVGTECQILDLSAASIAAEIVKQIGQRSPAVIVGGPPCQGFSTAGPRRSNDPRNGLIYNYLDIVARTLPRWFLFENVEGILTSNGGKDIVALVRALAKIGYVVRLEKLNFAGYGIPQTRKRVLIVGNRLGMEFTLPAERFAYNSGKSRSMTRSARAPTLFEAIGDLPKAASSEQLLRYRAKGPASDFARSMRGEAVGVWHHFSGVSDEVAKVATLLQPGQTMRDLPPKHQHESYQRRAYRRVMDGMPTEKRGGAPAGYKRLQGDLNSLTITSASTREFIHPVEHRALTLRECARLQTFPDGFTFQGNAPSIARQIGNAIPPMAAKIIAQHLIEQDGLAGGRHGRVRKAEPGLLGFRLTDATAMSPALEKTHNELLRLQGDRALPLFRTAANG